MTDLERKRRSRFMRSLEQYEVGRDRKWFATAPPDVVAYQFAHAHFDFSKKEPNYSRWKEIHAYVLYYLAELDRDFRD